MTLDEATLLKLKDTEYFIEAASFEILTLWNENKDRVDWKELTSGVLFDLGTLDGMLVTMSIRWAKINGHLVAFYDLLGQVVDYRMVDALIQKVPKTNAMNFHHCLHFCKIQ